MEPLHERAGWQPDNLVLLGVIQKQGEHPKPKVGGMNREVVDITDQQGEPILSEIVMVEGTQYALSCLELFFFFPLQT